MQNRNTTQRTPSGILIESNSMKPCRASCCIAFAIFVFQKIFKALIAISQFLILCISLLRARHLTNWPDSLILNFPCRMTARNYTGLVLVEIDAKVMTAIFRNDTALAVNNYYPTELRRNVVMLAHI